MLKTTRFMNLECVELANTAVSLLITQSVGPRILKLALSGGENLFAELPDVALNCPGKGLLHLHGGHRLWHAPEKAARTYLPDDAPVAVSAIENGVRVVQPVEAETGIQKSLTITLPDAGATVIVNHTLANTSMWAVECAPWAITQMRAGGTAVLPQNTLPIDVDGLLPNRPLSLWPYTDINSPHIELHNDHITIHANMTEGSLKIGFPNPRGWLTYWYQGTAFVKTAEFNPAATYYDFGSSSECYCNDKFLELETLGPRTFIAPGSAVTHREVWHLFDQVAFDTTDMLVKQIEERLTTIS